MVRLHTFLLAVTLATGPAVACSNEHQREPEVLPHRHLDLEAREPFSIGRAVEFGEEVGKHRHTKHFLKGVDYGMQAANAVNTYQSRALDDDEDLLVREPFSIGKAVEFGEEVGKHRHTKHILKGVDYGMQAANAVNTYQSRALDDDEDLFVREPFSIGRAVEFGEEVGKHRHTKHILKGVDYGMQAANAVNTYQSRALVDDEDLFVREPFSIGKAVEFGEEVGKHRHTKHILKGVDYGMQAADAVNTYQSRALDDDEDLLVREPFSIGRAVEFGEEVGKHRHTKHFLKGVDYGMQAANAVNTYQSRALDDDEDLFGRAL